MPSARPVEARIHAGSLPLYDGFPYLVTRLVPSLSHIIPLPDAFDEWSLRSLARHQALCNQLATCLVLDVDRAWYLDGAGAESLTTDPPRGGIVMCDRLLPSPGLAQGSWWTEHSRRLRDYVEQRTAVSQGRYLLGDLTKGGRPATEREHRALAGTTSEGVPRGLVQCSTCAEWKGECLDSRGGKDDSPLIVTVACRCDNANRCAACLGLLAERKLNANYFNAADGGIWHVPGFSACSHRCRPESTWKNRRFNGGNGL
jgi:hypothetical protein